MKVDREQFINAVGPAAREAMLKTGIPASFLIADHAICSHFGTRRIALPFAVELQRFAETGFSSGENRWSYFLNKARGIRSHYGLKGEQKPASLTRYLMEKGYFGKKQSEANDVLKLIKSFRLAKWDAFSADDVRMLRRIWLQYRLLGQIENLTREAARAGLSRKAVISHLQKDAA